MNASDRLGGELRSPGQGDTLLSVEGLTVTFNTPDGDLTAVHNQTYRLSKGESLAIVGESGSGKTVSALTLMGLLATPPGRIDAGRVIFQGKDLLNLPEGEFRQLRGNDLAMVFQDPMSSLNPVLPIGRQIAEVLEEHTRTTARTANRRATELLEMVGIPDSAKRFYEYPHQFSGGQRQRIGIAMALACDPLLLIADEPTTALDVTIQAQLLELVRDLQAKLGMAVIWITHDLGVVANLVDRVAVMYAGHIVESGPVADVFDNPRHPYTVGLLGAIPTIEGSHQRLPSIPGSPPSMLQPPPGCPFSPRCPRSDEQCHTSDPSPRLMAPAHRAACWHPHDRASSTERPKQGISISTTRPAGAAPRADRALMRAMDVSVDYAVRVPGAPFKRQRIRAVNRVSLSIDRGQVVGLVGESGSGKSSFGRAILRLTEPSEGSILFEGTDLVSLDNEALRSRRREMQMVFQDPYGSLNPRHTVSRLISEPLRIQGIPRRDRDARVSEVLGLVGLDSTLADRRPHELSGGQRQRVGIGRALVTEPSFIVADEPVSALDVSIQAQIVNLLQDLRDRLGLTYLFIAHDLSMVRHISDVTAVMYNGEIVEKGPTNSLFGDPRHPYTRTLLAAVPVANPRAGAARLPSRPSSDRRSETREAPGCSFSDRCAYATALCLSQSPSLIATSTGTHLAACHHLETVPLQPIESAEIS